MSVPTVNISEIKQFMAKNKPVPASTAEGIDQILIDNAKILLAYQTEMKAKCSKDSYINRHYKHRNLFSLVNRLEKNIITLAKLIPPKNMLDVQNATKLKKTFSGIQVNLAAN